ncbi:Pc22g23690 [Penicillium rubens Wisconsin 54-1255]|uniref:Pc22g23690 protein n=2 Tax=Penicillium rubens TaxID=1108849 RepID=B6HW38_PENRW|nr:Pc22g23690 [Penicillium rubens Wisconsin 54-1255]
MQSAGKPTQPGIDLALPREKTQEEINIEKSGDIDALQRYRRNVVIGRSRYTGRVVELLRIEQDLRSTAQEEQYLSQKTKITGRWPLLRHDIQAELQTLNKRYWLLERQWWEARNSFVEGPLIRAFDLWRSHPLWYMHEFCSRIVCGCCVDRNIDKTRQLGAGHCTIECGCCRQSRGFDLTKSEKKKLLKDFHVMDDNSLYRERINRVSIWGLSLDSHDSPFDLIITLPGCERGLSKERMSTAKDESAEVFMLGDEEDWEEVVVP